MRITGGLYGGRSLKSPKDSAIRPTADKVRLAIFNMLQSRGCLIDSIILDAFCGTGAMGIEALSRGAFCCTFIDKSKESLGLCRENHAALKITAPCSFVLGDSTKPLVKKADIAPATLLFLDPPYRKDLIPQSLMALDSCGWVAPDAFIVMESEKSFDFMSLSNLAYETIFVRDYGDTRITLAQKSVSV